MTPWGGFHSVCFVLGVLLVPGVAPGQVLEEQGSCVTCHAALGDARLSDPVTAFANDIHAARGFGCTACHGGDPRRPGIDAMSPEHGFSRAPAPRNMPEFCGRCHSDPEFMKRYDPAARVDQVIEYATSVHGRRLLQLDDPNVATCVGCHPAHNIRPPSDPLSSVHPLNVAGTCGSCHADADHMAEYDIPIDQQQRYERSVHWELMSVDHDLSAPTCNDCHGNHGTAPPGVSWVGNICGQCHTVMADLFAQSLHARLFPLLGKPGCVACHGNHEIVRVGDEVLGLHEGAICVQCHQEGTESAEKILAMRALIDSLRNDFDSAETLLGRAERAGVEVSQAQFELEAANNSLVGSRAAVHAFSVDAVSEEVTTGLEITAQAHQDGQEAMRELRFRRTGLAISVTIILAFIIGLVLKIRQIESVPAESTPVPTDREG